jgi:hypothetical protein
MMSEQTANKTDAVACIRKFYSISDFKFYSIPTGWPAGQIASRIGRQNRDESSEDIPYGYPYYLLEHRDGGSLFVLPCSQGAAFRFGRNDRMQMWILSTSEGLEGRLVSTPVADEIEVPANTVVKEETAIRFINSFIDGRARVAYLPDKSGGANRLKSHFTDRPPQIFTRWRSKELPLEIAFDSGESTTCTELVEAEEWLRAVFQQQNAHKVARIRDRTGKSLNVMTRGQESMEIQFQNYDGDSFWHLADHRGSTQIPHSLGLAAILEWSINGELSTFVSEENES